MDGAFSAHVFQHFTSLNDAAAYFGEIHRVLAADGTIMIHAPTYIWPKLTIWPPFRRAFDSVYGAYKLLGAMKGRYIRWRMKKGEWRPYFAGLSYPVEWLEQIRR